MRSVKSSGALFLLGSVFLAGILLVGCGNKSSFKPITYTDLGGNWNATLYKVSNAASPDIAMELVSMGGQFSMQADDAGNFTGQAIIPEELGGPATLEFEGAFEIVGRDTLNVVFNPEIPPFITNFRPAFKLRGNILTLTDSNTTFDFDQDGEEEEAVFEGTLVRS
jgi:hypothetical protein